MWFAVRAESLKTLEYCACFIKSGKSLQCKAIGSDVIQIFSTGALPTKMTVTQGPANSVLDSIGFNNETYPRKPIEEIKFQTIIVLIISNIYSCRKSTDRDGLMDKNLKSSFFGGRIFFRLCGQMSVAN